MDVMAVAVDIRGVVALLLELSPKECSGSGDNFTLCVPECQVPRLHQTFTLFRLENFEKLERKKFH